MNADSAVFREAFSVAKWFHQHRIESFVNLFKGCAGQGARFWRSQNPTLLLAIVCELSLESDDADMQHA